MALVQQSPHSGQISVRCNIYHGEPAHAGTSDAQRGELPQGGVDTIVERSE